MFNNYMDKIFKAYDIRGIYPTEINEDIAYKSGMAFAVFIKEKYPEYNPIIGVARDSRLSSEALFSACVKGITDMGINVVDCGLTSTPTLYFCSWFYNFVGAIMITASHNPKEYNGFKFVGPDAVPIDLRKGLGKIRDMVIKNEFQLSEKKGTIIKKDPLSDYVDNVLKGFDNYNFSKFKICVDTANAVPIIAARAVFSRMGINADYMFDEIDGNFPNHSADPTIPKNLTAIKEKMKDGKYDLGIVFDGDGDRIIFLDESGNDIVPDLITALISKIILKERPQDRILYDVSSSKSVAETIERYGGIPVISIVGHSLIKSKMRAEGIYFGGEKSGHYYYQDNKYCEAPFFVLFSILKHMIATGQNLSDLLKEFRTYHGSKPIAIKIDSNTDIKNIYSILEEKYKDGKIIKIDGIRIDFADWWFLARKSNTEPLIRLTIESKNENLIPEKVKELEAIISSNQ